MGRLHSRASAWQGPRQRPSGYRTISPRLASELPPSEGPVQDVLERVELRQKEAEQERRTYFAPARSPGSNCGEGADNERHPDHPKSQKPD